ncbi:hypothetical protein BGX30_003867 [Mortierella sp. GBA39]|nr:hypothetical protein BGX30_003867 [Mortierella sp. GBA39]
MKAYRTGLFYAGMDTNNFVESWHNQLKSHFLRGHNRGRGDRLIYVLSHDVDSFFQAEGMRSQVRFGRHSKGETFDRKQQRFLARKTQEELRAMVIYIDGKYVMRSFTVEGVLYNITLDSNRIMGCNCTHFIRTRRVCKHMMTLSCAYGRDRNLILPSLQVLKFQSTRIEEAFSSPLQFDVDPFEGRLEMSNVGEDENFVEVQAVKELLRRVLYTEEWTPQQTERVNVLAHEIATTLHLENDTPLLTEK